MWRIRVWGLIGLVAVGCAKRPLSNQRMKLQPDASPTRGDSSTIADAAVPDAVIGDAPWAGAETLGADTGDAHADAGPDAADVRADSHADSPPPAPDAGAPDLGGDLGPSNDGPPPDATTTDAGHPPDGGCAGNGRPAQAGSLYAPPVDMPLPDPQQSSGFNASSVGVADITGDWRADIVVASHHPALVVYPQLPGGGLGTPISYPIAPIDPNLPYGPDLLAIGDLNGDGRLDVVFDRPQGIGFMPGNAGGGLGPEQLLPAPAQATSGSNLAIADIDGDGRSDLVVMPYLTNGVEVRLQSAAGQLVSTGFFTCARQAYESLAIGDVNGDGRPDIALGTLDGEICLLLQKSAGEFADAISLPVGGMVSAVGIGNFGAGGCGPAIAFAVDGNRPTSRLGLITWTAGAPSAPAYMDAYDIPENMAVLDVDGDGRDDVVLLHIVWLNVGVFRGTAAGGLAAEELYPTSWINYGPGRLAVGDVNGDGRPDIVSADFDLMVLYHR